LSSREFKSAKDAAKFEKKLAQIREHVQKPGHSFSEEIDGYYKALLEAFTSAAEGNADEALRLRTAALDALYREVIVPFNALIGQEKKSIDLTGLKQRAMDRFANQVESKAARETFSRVLGFVQEIVQSSSARWNGSQLSWIPLHLAVTPEAATNQSKLNQVIADVSRTTFTDANQVEYILADQFHDQVKSMVLATRHYQVLHVHDVTGIGKDKTPDPFSWDLAIHGYGQAMLNAIRELDSGKRANLPVFMLFFDQHYYEMNRSRGLLSFLENLSGAKVKSTGNAKIDAEIRELQQKLKAAIESSPKLSALAKSDPAALRSILKVAINVTNPNDPSYSKGLLPDGTIRDHRKLAFRDIFEDRPREGEAMVTGMGIGREYSGEWEDRALKIRGDSLPALKDSTRELFLSQGFKPSEVPYFLKARSKAINHDELVQQMKADGWTSTASFEFNKTGYASKQSTAAKAALYELAPTGSTLLAPDSIWQNDFWTGMFTGAALRGAKLYMISASQPNSSIGGLAQAGVEQNITRAFEISQALAAPIRQAKGELRVGIYRKTTSVRDLDAYAANLRAGLGGPGPFQTPKFAETPSPMLHLKANLLMSAELMEILKQPEMTPLIERYLAVRKAQLEKTATAGDVLSPNLLKDLIDGFERDLGGLSPAQREKMTAVLMVGSQNLDRRSMVIEGEVSAMVTGYDALVGLLDMIYLSGSSHWPTTFEEFRKLVPEDKSRKPGLSRILRPLL
jgi:hypothetical protein